MPDSYNADNKMKHFLILVLTTAIAILSASAISWPFYEWTDSESLVEFHRFTRILIILSIIVFTVFVLKACNLPLLRTLGFIGTETKPLHLFLTGLFTGTLIALLLAIIFWLIELKIPDENHRIWPALPRIALTGLLIAIIEETFFRGVLMDSFIKKGQIMMAVLLPSALFAILHFIAVQESPPDATAAWYSGVWKLVDGIREKHMLYDAIQTATALFWAGVFLSLIRLSANHIMPCIGIHCGWIVVAKFNKKLTDTNPDSDFTFLISNYDGFIGWGAAIWFGLITLWWFLNLRRRITANNR